MLLYDPHWNVYVLLISLFEYRDKMDGVHSSNTVIPKYILLYHFHLLTVAVRTTAKTTDFLFAAGYPIRHHRRECCVDLAQMMVVLGMLD